MGELETDIPGVRAECCHAAGPVRSFVDTRVLVCRMRLGEPTRHDHRARLRKRALMFQLDSRQPVTVNAVRFKLAEYDRTVDRFLASPKRH